LRRLLRTGLAAAASFAAAAGPALADTATSSNWAGYAVAAVPTTDGSDPVPLSFTSISGTWVEPAASCTTGTQTYAAFWVGLGGFGDSSQALEQIGTEADCSAADRGRHSAWYELVPAEPVQLKLKIRARDRISTTVTVSGQVVTLRLRNLTRKTVFTKTLTMDEPDVSSAEWIAEAPSACDNFGRCNVLPLTNFGTVTFSKASATAAGHTGTISDPAWAATAIELDSGGALIDPRFASNVETQAVPAGLSADGASFAVTWQQPSAATP
jgi:hypothetical protein